MSRILKKRSKKAGLPPGSLIHVGEILSKKISITAIDYDENFFIEKDNLSLQECLTFIKSPTTTWINIRGIHDSEIIYAIGSHFGLHPLVMEDIMNSGQRSKLDDYKDYIFIVLRLLHFNTENQHVEDSQVSIVLGENYVITFSEDSQDTFENIRNRIRTTGSRLRTSKADYLCYTIMDNIVDSFFSILETVDQKLELLEEALIKNATPELMVKIQRSKRDVLVLRKAIWPTREVINHFRRLETNFIKTPTKIYIHDVYDHTIQAIDTIESFRDIVSGMLDVYLSNVSQRMNEIMKVLTVVSTIFVPLTFIASLYGMNFENIPELHTHYGYFITLGVMLIMALSMIIFFRKKKWI